MKASRYGSAICIDKVLAIMTGRVLHFNGHSRTKANVRTQKHTQK